MLQKKTPGALTENKHLHLSSTTEIITDAQNCEVWQQG